MVTLVHGCKKHFVTFVLLNDTLSIVLHDVNKAILCFSRDGCDSCELHDVLVEMCVI